MKKDIKETATELVEEYKDHPVVEKTERKVKKWWKGQTKMGKLIYAVAAVLVVYGVFFG